MERWSIFPAVKELSAGKWVEPVLVATLAFVLPEVFAEVAEHPWLSVIVTL